MVRNSRPMPLDSASMPLEGQQKKLMKFDPTINTGTIIQIGAILLTGFFAFSALKTELATTKVEIAANKDAAMRDNAVNAEALKDLKAEVKDLKKSVDDIKEGVAILRGRAADTSSRNSR